jgi:hypothetical protein
MVLSPLPPPIGATLTAPGNGADSRRMAASPATCTWRPSSRLALRLMPAIEIERPPAPQTFAPLAHHLDEIMPMQ